MPRERTGSIVEKKVKDKKTGKIRKRIYARVTFTDRRGNHREVWRKVESRTDARHVNKQLIRELETEGEEVVIDHSRATFAEWCDYYKKHFAVPAEYKDEIKIKGMRYPENAHYHIDMLKGHFGKMLIRDITYQDISSFKQLRLNTPTKNDIRRYEKELDKNKDARLVSTRSIVTVNREMAQLRAMLNRAVRRRWLSRNPMNDDEPLVKYNDEKHRQRILTFDEEKKLLEAADAHPQRLHLRPILICAIDTGMRRGEILKLTWKDVDFDKGVMYAVSYKGNLRIERPVPITTRLKTELLKLYDAATGDPSARVFGVAADIKRSWTKIREMTGLMDVRLHDIRHHAATLMIRAGLSLEETGRILGHRQPKTTYRYINVDVQTARRTAEALDSLRKEDG